MSYSVYGFSSPGSGRELKRICYGYKNQGDALRRATEFHRLYGYGPYDSPFIVSRDGSVLSIAAVTFGPPPITLPPPATIGRWV